MSQSDSESYENLLARLRIDLQLDPSVDLLPPALVSAQGKPWKVDAGTGTATWTASTTSAVVTVSHRLGRVPLVVVAMDQSAHGVWYAVFGTPTATQFQIFGDATGAITVTSTFGWVAIG